MYHVNFMYHNVIRLGNYYSLYVKRVNKLGMSIFLTRMSPVGIHPQRDGDGGQSSGMGMGMGMIFYP